MVASHAQGRRGRAHNAHISRIARTVAAAAPPLALTAGLQLPLPQLLMSTTALAANECGSLAAGANTKSCQGPFTNGIEYGPTSAQGPLILNLGDGSIANAAAVVAPTIIGVGQYGVVVGNGIGFPSPITIPTTGAQVDVTVNVNQYSQVQGTAGGVFVWTDGSGNDATINNYGSVLATGQGTGSLGIGLNAVAGNPLANPTGSGDATVNNYHEVNAKNNGINAWSEAGAANILNGFGATVTSSNGNGLSTLDPLTGLVPTGGAVTIENAGVVNAAKVGIIGASLGGNVVIDGVQPLDPLAAKNYGSVVTTGGPGILALTLGTGDVTVDSGDVTSGSSGFGLPGSFGGLGAFNISGGVLAGSLGSGAVDVTTHGQTATSGYFGVAALSVSGSSTVTIKDDVVGNLTAPLVTTVPVIGGASIVLGGTKDAALNLDPGKTVNASGIGLFATNAGSGKVDIEADATSIVNSDALGVVGLGVQNGNVTVHTGAVNVTGSGSFTPLGLPVSLTGGVLGASLGGGDVDVTTNGAIHVTDGLFGAAAYSTGGEAHLTVNAEIDPALIGGIAITGGSSPAIADINALTQGTLVGVLAGNFGSGNVDVNVNDTSAPVTGSVESDGIGILAFKLGDGDVNVNVAGAIGGITGDATGGDGVSVDYALGDGDIYVGTYNNYDPDLNPNGHIGTIDAGGTGIGINRLGGTGNIGLMLGADITADDSGVSILRAAGAGNNFVNVGIDFGATPSPDDDVLKPMDIVAAHGDGIRVVSVLTGGSTDSDPNTPETAIQIFQGSSVTADNGSAVRVLAAGTGNHDVYLGNAGSLVGDGDLLSPTVGVLTTGSFFTRNEESGSVTTDGGQPYALIYGVGAAGHVGIENHGVMTGAMALGSLNGGIDVDNIYGSGGVWNTSGLNVYASFDDINIDNEQDEYGNSATINAQGLTVFTFATDGHAGVNNAGIFNVKDLDTGSFTIPGVTIFAGLDDFNNSLNYGTPEEPDMRGGILDMRNDISDYGLTIPNYGTGIGNAVIMADASFNGGPGSRLGVDAFLAGDTAFGGSVNSSSDLLIVGSVNHGNGGASTAVYVNDTNMGPGEYNPEGIPVVGVLSGETQLGDYILANGPIDKGLFTYDLFLDRTPAYTLPGHDDAAKWVLASYPDSSATALAQSLNIINNMWDTTAGGWIDRSGDLRGLYGSYGSGGADLPESAGASGNGPNANGTWARAIGNWGSRNGSSTIQPFANQSVTVSSDYDESLWAIQGGIDHAFETGKGTFVVGLMGGYEANSVTFATPGDSANYKAPMAGIYADWINGPAYVDALFKADFLKADLNIGGDSASTDGLALGGRIETGYRYKLNGGWFVEPTASLAYVNTHLDSVSLDNTDVDFDNGQSLRGEVGFRSGGAFANAGLLFQPYVTASLGNEFLGDNSVFLASGDGVTVTDNVRGIYGKAGLGVNVTNVKRNVSTYLQGTYMFSDDYQSGSAKGGIRFNW